MYIYLYIYVYEYTMPRPVTVLYSKLLVNNKLTILWEC